MIFFLLQEKHTLVNCQAGACDAGANQIFQLPILTAS